MPARGFRGNFKHWTDEDHENLKKMYPTSPQDQILNVLQHRTWHSIQKEASRLKIKREINEIPVVSKSNDGKLNVLLKKLGRPKKKVRINRGSHQIMISKSVLAKMFVQQELTVEDIAFKLKVDPEIVRKHIFKFNL